MKMIVGAAIMAAGWAAAPAVAQSWSEAQTDVWQAVAGYWERHVDQGNWHEAMTADSYGWGGGGSGLVPRSRAQYAASARVFGAEGEVLHYELAPLAITVRENVAVAHYYATVTETDHAGERDTSVERCTDTMIRENGRWMFLGWGCAEMGEDD